MTLVEVASCLRARASGFEGSGLVVISVPAAGGLRLLKPGKYDVAAGGKQTGHQTPRLTNKLFYINQLRDRRQPVQTRFSAGADDERRAGSPPHLDGDQPGELQFSHVQESSTWPEAPGQPEADRSSRRSRP